MPGVGLHRRRIAPVGAHDERRARRRPGAPGPRRAGRSRCGGPTRCPSTHTTAWWLTDSKRIAYTPARGTMTVVRYHATEPANERSPATPRTWRGVGREGHRHRAPGEVAGAPAQRVAAPGAVAAHDPRAVEQPRAGRAGDRGQRRRGPPLLADGARHQREEPPPRPPGRRPAPPIAQRPSAVERSRRRAPVGAADRGARGRAAHNTANGDPRPQVALGAGGGMSATDDSSVVEDGDDARRRRARADDAQREAAHAEARARQRAEVGQALDLRVGEVGLVGGPEDARPRRARAPPGPAGAADGPSPRRRCP